jgi:hypothetical protein
MQTFQGIRVAAMSFPPGLCSREDPLRCSSGGFSFLPAFIDHVVPLLTSKAIAVQMRQANCSPWNTVTCGTVQSKGSLCNYPGCQTIGFWKLGS